MGHLDDSFRTPRALALEVYALVVDQLSLYHFRDSPVGSLRRESPLVGDIDIQLGVMEEDIKPIHDLLRIMGDWQKGGPRAVTIHNLYDQRLNLEVSLVYPPRNWYAMLAIRTGPAEMEIWMRERLREQGFTGPVGELQPTSERDFFERFLEVPYVSPQGRNSWSR